LSVLHTLLSGGQRLVEAGARAELMQDSLIEQGRQPTSLLAGATLAELAAGHEGD
jgi:hypothetical protein